MRIAALVFSLLACVLAAGPLGCVVGVTPSPPAATPTTGTLTVTWLMAGTTDPSLCAGYGVSSLELAVYDTAGNPVTTVDAPCESFSLTVELPDGRYTADATLVDSASRSRSVTKPLSSIDIVAGTDLTIDLDFPSSSML
jgi:hypothetical protein